MRREKTRQGETEKRIRENRRKQNMRRHKSRD